MTMRGEVFLHALGAEAARLHPEILAQMRAPVGGGRADGVFAVAGSRWGRLGAVAIPVVGQRLLITRHARDVPFVLHTAIVQDPSGRDTLRTVRELHFDGTTQVFEDRLLASMHRGLTRTLLGARGRVELIEECDVTADGFLRMRTRRAALRIAGHRFALRGPLAVTVELVDGWDADHGRRTIDMRATNPLLGCVLEYRGWYRWRD
jgi:hypothetical protein